MFTSLALWPLENLLNRMIRSDDYLARQVQGFAGKCVEVTSRSPGLHCTLCFDSKRLQLSGSAAETLGLSADARIEGEAADLLRLLFAKPGQQALANPALQMSGDLHLIQDLYNLLQNLDLQWEDYLAPVLGDVLTEQGSQLQKESSAWLRDSSRRVTRNIEDYLKEEARAVPHQYAIAAFDDRLDELRLQLDRAEARVHLLQSRLDQVSD